MGLRSGLDFSIPTEICAPTVPSRSTRWCPAISASRPHTGRPSSCRTRPIRYATVALGVTLPPRQSAIRVCGGDGRRPSGFRPSSGGIRWRSSAYTFASCEFEKPPSVAHRSNQYANGRALPNSSRATSTLGKFLRILIRLNSTVPVPVLRTPFRVQWAILYISTVAHLSETASKEFVSFVRDAMRDRGISSVYRLYLLTDFNKATIYRWFSGTVRIPVYGAEHLLDVLAGEGHSKSIARAAALLTKERDSESFEKRLLGELKARKLPLRRTIEALRAAGVTAFD